MWCDAEATAILEELRKKMWEVKPEDMLGFMAQWMCAKVGCGGEEVQDLNTRANKASTVTNSPREAELCKIISQYQSMLAKQTVTANRHTNGDHKDTSVVKHESLLGMCNPLLDMVLSVEDSYLDKWGLKSDNAILASEETLPLFQELAKDKSVVYIPGGSGLNTLRVAQWLLSAPGSTMFIGTTGEDEFGNILHRATATEGVGMLRLNVENEPTGTCAVLADSGNNRSLVANLGASAVFKPEWLAKNCDLHEEINGAGLYYITGFFLRTTPETVRRVVDIALARKKPVCVNLSAPFVCAGVGQLFEEMFPHVEIVFGNNSEFKALEEALGWKLNGDTGAILNRIASVPPAKGTSGIRHVVMTQGSEEVIVASRSTNGVEVHSFPTPHVPSSEVVDTNGAGDAFVGGFLAKYSRQGNISECVKIGQWAASIIICRPGCTIPPLPPGCLVTTGSSQLADTRPAISRNTIPKQKSPPASTRKLKRVRSANKYQDPAK